MKFRYVKYGCLLALILYTDSGMAQESLSSSLNAFALDYYRETYPENDNYVVSTTGIQLILGIINELSGNSPRGGLQQPIYLEGVYQPGTTYYRYLNRVNLDNSRFLSYCQQNLQYADEANPESAINYSKRNSIWYKKPLPALSDTLKGWEVDLFTLADSAKFTARAGGPFVAPNMSDFLMALPDSGAFMASSFTRFEGELAFGFEPKKTKTKKFHDFKGEKNKAPFMHRKYNLRYYEDDLIQAVSIPYQCNINSLIIIMPHSKEAFHRLEGNLDTIYYQKILKNMVERPVKLSIPKFKLHSNTLLRNDSDAFEMYRILGNEVRLPNLEDGGNLWLGGITQSTSFELNERLTEDPSAAVQTKPEYIKVEKEKNTNSSKKFFARQPFLFLLIDEAQKNILIMGRYVSTP